MAVKGDGIFSNTDLFLCVTTEVLPCNNSGALETVAPYATAIAWCPRQTPKSGIFLSAQYLTNSTLIPAASGVQFHPESVLTEHGYQMIGNWLEICGDKGARARSEGLSPVVIKA